EVIRRTSMTIAFIGVGNMGAPMVRNLLLANYHVVVYDLQEAAMVSLVEVGATSATSVADAVQHADELVITMLPAGPHVHAAYCGKEGVLHHVTPGLPLIDCSTIDPATAQTVSTAAEVRGNPMADAPVSGGTAGAAAGTLTFMVGGNEDLFTRIEPVLKHMGKRIIHCGGAGAGQIAKLCNNMLLAISMAGVAEAMALGDKLGMDPKVLADVINSSSGRCWASDTYNPWPEVLPTAPASRGYTGGFSTRLMLKDLALATEAARLSGQPAMMGAAAQQLYQWMAAEGHSDEDFSAILKLYRQT